MKPERNNGDGWLFKRMILQENVFSFIKKNQLVKKGDLVIAGVSGGPDSVALLKTLYDLRNQLGIRLYVGHYNHQLRSGAKTDQAFVERLAKEMNLSCAVGIWDKEKQSRRVTEEQAREKRFEFLIGLAKKIKADAVALAHHRDDLAETVLMRILRGTGLEGVRGILPQRTMEDVKFIRPFLGLERREIEVFLKKHRLSFRLDPTNRSTDFMRNKIRLQLLPLLKSQYSPAIMEILANYGEIASQNFDFIEGIVEKIFNASRQTDKRRGRIAFPIDVLKKQHPAVRRAILRRLIREIKGDTRGITVKHIREIENLLANNSDKTEVNLPSTSRL